MSQLVHTEMSTVRGSLRAFTARLHWTFGVLMLLLVGLYSPVLSRLAAQWRHDPNFSHGFFVPLFSAFVIWQERGRLQRIQRKPSWTGLIILSGALCMLIVGQMGAELFLSRSSFVLALAGLAILCYGWTLFRAALFPWAFLFLMIPVPALVFNQIAFPLQLLASRLSAAILPLLGIPILREGNIIYLPSMPLNVAEACSGIRSLMSLVTLAVIYGYLLERRPWVRIGMVAASVPIAVVANCFRIVGTGLIAQYWGPAKAEGYSHETWGLAVFVVSLVLLYSLHRLVCAISPDRGKPKVKDVPYDPIAGQSRNNPTAHFVVGTLLIVATAAFLLAHSGSEVFPPRLALQSFPQQFDAWTLDDDLTVDDETLEVLKPSDYLLRVYRHSEENSPEIDLFIAYFASQRTGETIHSPKNCLPGAGWTPLASSRIQLSTPGHAPFPVNRYIITKGENRQLVLYWYWAHDRGVASEYLAKYYLVADSLKMHRSDGSLVRVATPLLPGETANSAEQRLVPFVTNIVPMLETYIPR